MRIPCKRITLFLMVIMTVLSLQSSSGQEKEKENTNTSSKFGLGVSLFNIVEYTWDQPNSLYVTFNIGSKFRIEPKIGFVYSDGFEAYSVGIGGFGIKAVSKFNLLYGLRLGYNSNETTLIAPTVGGEYFFIKNFSIGSEIQLQGLIDEEIVVLTNSSVIVRFYF